MEHNHTELYERLGVAPNATKNEIKQAYRKAARKLLHASHGNSDENEEYFKSASEAYNILSDEDLRKIYDREGLEGVTRFQEEQKHRDLPSIFSGGVTPPGVPKNPDFTYKIYATLEEFYSGKVRQLRSTRSVICPKCKGFGRPIGPEGEGICSECKGKRTIAESCTLRVTLGQPGSRTIFGGKGSQEDPTKAPGNVIIITEQLDHPTFKPQGNKLILDVSVPLAQFTNGFEITFEHVSGYVIVGKSDPNIVVRDGDIFKVRGEGLPNQYQQRGDLFIRFHNSNQDGVIYGNKIDLVYGMPCETRIRYVTAEKVDEIPQGEQCVHQ